jgi:nucleotide-binding universal stress UspA family protein
MTTRLGTKIEKILIAVDKAGYKEKIIAYGIILAKGSGASVTAIHVLDESILESIGDFFGSRVDEYQKTMRKNSEELLTEIKQIMEKEGIKTNTEVISDKSVAQGIVTYARESGVDVIVIGTKGLTGVEKFLMGGVASSVIHDAHCPVVAVR